MPDGVATASGRAQMLALVGGLIALEAAFTAADLLLGRGAHIATEERLNAHAGTLVACGHLERLWDMQYRTFCGGCSAEALLAAPWFRLVGATTLAWKAIPLFFHGIVLAAGSLLVARVVRRLAPDPAVPPSGGLLAAATFLALLVGAPTWYRDLLLTGWGNHVESAAFPLTAAFLATLAIDRGLRAFPLTLLSGLVAGLGLWFCFTSGWGLPALLGVALLAWRRGLPLLVLTVPVGLLPLYLYWTSRPGARPELNDMGSGLDLASPVDLFGWVFGDFLRGGMWRDLPDALSVTLSAVGWGGLWLLGAWGIVACVRAWLRRPVAERAPVLFVPLGLATLLGAYLLRQDLWSSTTSLRAWDPMDMRYRAPLYPLLALSCAVAVPVLPAGRVRRGVGIGIALFVALGLGVRAGDWHPHVTAAWGLPAMEPATVPDVTAPTGRPPERNPGMQGRFSDVEGAIGFALRHRDDLPICTASHVGEAGRRLGLGLLGVEADRLMAALGPFARTLGGSDLERHLAEGLALSLNARDGSLRPDAEERLEALRPAAPDLAVALARAMGRRAALSFPSHVPEAVAAHPTLTDAVCEGAAMAWLQARTWDGTRPPGAGDGVSPEEYGHAVCAGTPGWDVGLGWGWARYVGCLPHDARLLTDVLGGEPGLRAAWEEGCAFFRGSAEPRDG